MKIIIAGSRSVRFFDEVAAAVMGSGFNITEVVSGTARGADQFGEEWARRNGVPVKRFPADWNLHGRSAGHIRNRQMGNYADGLVAVWDEVSRGTKGMIDYMDGLNKPYYVHIINNFLQ